MLTICFTPLGVSLVNISCRLWRRHRAVATGEHQSSIGLVETTDVRVDPYNVPTPFFLIE